MNKQEVIAKAESFVKQKHGNDTTGHDWFHIDRVRNLAKYLAIKEGADSFICELAALLHDVADEKLNESETEGLFQLKHWLNENVQDKDSISKVLNIIEHVSYKGGHNSPVETIEGKVVQDADRLDALGAIGIARTFTYAGAKKQAMYDPSIAVRDQMSKEEYRNGKSTAINHFYEKLFKLKSLLNTNTAIEIAEKRTTFMEQYVDMFMEEWNFQK
jgi:uncharacterized protein